MLMPRHPVPTPSMPTLIHDDYPLTSDTRERAKALAEKLGSLDLRIGYGLSRRWSGGRGGHPIPTPTAPTIKWWTDSRNSSRRCLAGEHRLSGGSASLCGAHVRSTDSQSRWSALSELSGVNKALARA